MPEREGVDLSQETVKDTVTKAGLRPEVRTWLEDQADYLLALTDVYAKNPDIFGLPDDLQKDPLLILKTVLYSADQLYGYQQDYDRALSELAEVNHIDPSNLNEVPEKLQEVSLARERQSILEQYASGGVIAIGLMGTGASGKGTIGKLSGLDRVVNVTTRPRRPSETHGKDYFYIRELDPKVRDSLDTDTGFNVVSRDTQGNPVFEQDSQGQPVDYFTKHGPYLVTVHRPGRAKHGTPIDQFNKHYAAGKSALFFEHGPVQVQEAGIELPKHIKNAKVVPVCILPPKRGVLPLAFRMAVRTYGDKEHQDTTETRGYKIEDGYIESTIGKGQIAELRMTGEFSQGEHPLGIAYIVNDELSDAVAGLKSLIANK